MPEFFVDMHIHSKYSAATSEIMDLEHISYYSRFKGLNIVATGDVLHPKWLSELKSKLEDNEGLFSIKDKGLTPFFMLSGEIFTVYQLEGKKRRTHHVLIYPSFYSVEQTSDLLARYGDLASNGRPIVSLAPEDLVSLIRNVDDRIEIFPAHIWTPHFSIFGVHGYSSVDEAYGSNSERIHLLETGLSSDPEMNWSLSSLDRFKLVSNSDSHSPYPFRIGREANLFQLPQPTYECLLDAIRNHGASCLLKTVETFPQYGKYHWSGHRSCNFSASPEEYIRLGGLCPVCGRKLTNGVDLEVRRRADRPRGYVPEGAKPFIRVIQLSEILSKISRSPATSAKVWNLYEGLIKRFGSEYSVLLSVPIQELDKVGGKMLSDIISKMRQGALEIRPGYDGIYGELVNASNCCQKNDRITPSDRKSVA